MAKLTDPTNARYHFLFSPVVLTVAVGMSQAVKAVSERTLLPVLW